MDKFIDKGVDREKAKVSENERKIRLCHEFDDLVGLQ